MRRDRVVATYGRHRQRVITVDAVGPWLGARDNIFSSSSDSFRSQSSHNESSTDRKRVFDSFSSSKENESEVSWIQEKQGGRYARKRQFGKAAMSKKQHTIRNNVFDSSVDTSDLNINAAKMRTSQQQKDVLKDKTNGLYTSPLNTKETKDKPIPTGRKKQVKLKRVADTTKKSIQAARPSNNSVDPSSCEMSSRFNFAELENYSLVISDSPLIETGAVGYSPEIEVRGSRKTSITAATTALTSTPQANNLVSKNLHKNLLKSGLMQTHNSAHMTTPNERSVKSKGDLTNSILGQQTVRPPRLGQSSTPLGAVPVSNLQQSSTPRHSSAFALISMETGKERIAVQSGKQFEENTPGKHSQYDRLHLSTFSSIASSPCLADMSALSHKSNVSELCSPSFHSAQSELSCRVELTHHSLDSLRKIANNSRRFSNNNNKRAPVETPSPISLRSELNPYRFQQENQRNSVDKSSRFSDQYESCSSQMAKRLSVESTNKSVTDRQILGNDGYLARSSLSASPAQTRNHVTPGLTRSMLRAREASHTGNELAVNSYDYSKSMFDDDSMDVDCSMQAEQLLKQEVHNNSKMSPESRVEPVNTAVINRKDLSTHADKETLPNNAMMSLRVTMHARMMIARVQTLSRDKKLEVNEENKRREPQIIIGVPRAGVGSRREEEGKEHEEEDEESEEEEEDKEEEEEEKGEQGECVEGVEDLSDIEEGSESVSDIRYELTHMSLADDTAADQSHCSTNQATENGQPTLQNEPQKGRTNTGSSVNSFRRDPVLRDLNEPVLPTFQGRFLRSHKKLMMSDGFEMRQRVSKQQTNMSYNDYSVLVDETNSPVQDRQQITYNVSSQECIELSSDIIEVSDGESDSDGESGSGANNTNSEHLFAAAKYELAEVAEEEQNRTSENESREETEQTETEIRNIQCEMENDDDISYQLVKGPPETQTVHSTDQDSNQEVSDETTRLEDKENTLESGEEDTEQENIDCDEREAESDLSDQSESEIIDYDESEAEKDASNQSDSEYEPEADDTNNCVSSGEESECASNDEGSSDENGEASEEEDTAEQPVAKTPAQTSRRSTVLDRLCYSLKALTPIRAKKGGPVISPRTKVLLSCDQQHPVPFSKCFTAMMLRKCVKIGEGVYGEVFKTQRAKNNVAMKIIPIEGDFEVNDEPQKSYAEMLPEIVISKELSDLRTNQDNMTSAFVNVHGVSVVRGRYPGALLRQWDDFHDTKGSENDRPDMFGSDQLYVVFEFEECGCDLEGFEFSSPAQARSVLHQVALALAVAENALQFEHRDLHWGNVLVKSTREQHVTHVLDGKHMQVPTAGVKAAVIDFTLSRLRKDDCAVFCDLSRDPTLFIGQGDYQFEVYRLMQQENGNDWSAYRPFTNVLWMRYLADKLLNSKPYPQSSCKQYQLQLRELSKFVQDVLQYSSATHLVCECPYLQYT